MKKDYYSLIEENKIKIAVIGLGYVGLPLAIEFGKRYDTTGFDINNERVNELNDKFDKTKEVSYDDFKSSKFLSITNTENLLKQIDIFIITVPTPVDETKTPNLDFIRSATEIVGNHLKENSIVIYESTVYPGCTEEYCVPILENTSGLKYNENFYCGYSPERINPGDKEHNIRTIKKVVSGSNKNIGLVLEKLYSIIIDAGIYLAPNIKVAEAAKVIENAQRDINIAFINELALVFDRLGISTIEVLKAAGTKWNFLDFKPGLVGGHCIGVDPYYLASKAQSIGYHPEMILAGRRINDSMGMFVANKLIKLMINDGIKIKGAKILILGITFKENCPDIRNTRVIDIINELSDYDCIIDVNDPYANKNDVRHEYGIDLKSNINKDYYNAMVLCVAHDEYLDFPFRDYLYGEGIIFDIKGLWSNYDKVYSL